MCLSVDELLYIFINYVRDELPQLTIDARSRTLDFPHAHIMLPYQAMAMDYASASFQRHPAAANVGHHHHAAGGPGGGGPGSAAAAFSPSWFVPADLCMPFAKQNQPLVEPGLVLYHTNIIFLFGFSKF